MTLVFGNQRDEDVPLKKEFDKLDARYPYSYGAVYTVSKGDGKKRIQKRLHHKRATQRGNAEGGEGKVHEEYRVRPGLEESLARKEGFIGFSVRGGILEGLGYRHGIVHTF